MKAKEYVKRAIQTESNDFKKLGERFSTERNIRLNHSAYGVMTEIGELFEMLEKPELDLTNLREECSDTTWYVALAVDELKLDIDDIIKKASERDYLKSLSSLSQREQVQFVLNKAIIHGCQYLDLMKKSILYIRDLDLSKVEDCLINVMNDMIILLKVGNFNDLEEVFDINIAKLQKKRFKQGKFTETEAVVRDLEEERKTLEQKD